MLRTDHRRFFVKGVRDFAFSISPSTSCFSPHARGLISLARVPTGRSEPVLRASLVRLDVTAERSVAGQPRQFLRKLAVIRGGPLGWVHATSYFPGHMAKANTEIIENVRSVDAIIEVRDARAPMSSAAAHLDAMLQQKGENRIIVLNKMELISAKQRRAVTAALEGKKVHFVSARSGQGLQALLKAAIALVLERKKGYFKGTDTAPAAADSPHVVRRQTSPIGIPLLILVAGVPNTGKSSLINAFRHLTGQGGAVARGRGSKAAVTGSMPGVTRKQTAFQVSWGTPAVFMLDTPGVLPPKLGGWLMPLRLGMIDVLKHERAGMECIGGFALHYLATTQPEALLEWPSTRRVLTSLVPWTPSDEDEDASVEAAGGGGGGGGVDGGGGGDGGGDGSLAAVPDARPLAAWPLVSDDWREEATRLLHSPSFLESRKGRAMFSAKMLEEEAKEKPFTPYVGNRKKPLSAKERRQSREEIALLEHEEAAFKLLGAVARDIGTKRRTRLLVEYDMHGAAAQILRRIREGTLGKVFLDLNEHKLLAQPAKRD